MTWLMMLKNFAINLHHINLSTLPTRKRAIPQRDYPMLNYLLKNNTERITHLDTITVKVKQEI
jgi:hypothetical protein